MKVIKIFPNIFLNEITFLNGQKVKMREGIFWVREDNGKGYTIVYNCNQCSKDPEKHIPTCELTLGSTSH